MRKPFTEGQAVWVASTVRSGMFPTERYFSLEIQPNIRVCGYVPQDKIWEDRVLAVVMEIADDSAKLLFPGELTCANNPVSAPIPWLIQNAHDAGKTRPVTRLEAK